LLSNQAGLPASGVAGYLCKELNEPNLKKLFEKKAESLGANVCAG